MKWASWRQGVTRYQWLVLLVAWLGWVFDSMDATIYALVLQPALQELCAPPAAGPPPAMYRLVRRNHFLDLPDRLGHRGRSFRSAGGPFRPDQGVGVDILIYALFTGLAAWSQTWWQLALFRFVTALGIGGEWAAGATLVAEACRKPSATRRLAYCSPPGPSDFSWRRSSTCSCAMPGGGRCSWSAWHRRSSRSSCSVGEGAERGCKPGPPSERAAGVRDVQRLAELFSPGLVAGHAGGFRAGVRGRVRIVGRNELDADARPCAAGRAGPGCRGHYEPGQLCHMLLNVGALAGYLSFGPLADRLGRRRSSP